MKPVVALAVVVSLAAPACDSPDPSATGGEGASCLQEVLAGYRSLGAPARRVLGGYGAIVRESARLSFAAPVRGPRVTIAEVFDPPFDDVPAKLRPLFARVRGAFRETNNAIRDYRASSERVADVAERCAKSAAGDTAACRAALRETASTLRAAGAAAARSARRLRAQLRPTRLERWSTDLERHLVRVEGAASATAACG